MTMEHFAPLMFAGLVLIMLIGFPVAFSLSALGLLCGFIAIWMGWFPPEFMSALPLNVFGILSNDLLLAAGPRKAVRNDEVVDTLQAICAHHQPVPHVTAA